MLNSFHRVTLAEKTEEIFPKQVLVHFDSQHIPCYEICLILETPRKTLLRKLPGCLPWYVITIKVIYF